MSKNINVRTPGIKDEEFIRGKVPMTKEEIRVITLSKLRLQDDDVIVDIGAGTGSLSIECARLLDRGYVYAVERNLEGIDLIKKNKEKFGIHNMQIINEEAPKGLEEIKVFNKVIIGGSGGNLQDILYWAYLHMSLEGRIVINTVTLENTYRAMKVLEELEFKDIELLQVSCSKGHKVGTVTLMKALNPIHIISAIKK